jgi:adenylate cyclase
MAYTVMGDSVNLGSRIESLTKHYGVDIIVSEFVKAQVPDMIYRELDIVRVKGKDKPVVIFEPLGKASQVSTATLHALGLHEQALKSYRNQDWVVAAKQFKALDKLAPSTLNVLYLGRIKQFKQAPPNKNWDSVFNFETK